MNGDTQWLDAPTHSGFWWRYRSGHPIDVVSVRILPQGDVWCADTDGYFGAWFGDAKWLAIDVPAAPTEAE